MHTYLRHLTPHQSQDYGPCQSSAVERPWDTRWPRRQQETTKAAETWWFSCFVCFPMFTWKIGLYKMTSCGCWPEYASAWNMLKPQLFEQSCRFGVKCLQRWPSRISRHERIQDDRCFPPVTCDTCAMKDVRNMNGAACRFGNPQDWVERDSCVPQGKIMENHKVRLMEEIPNNHLGCIKPCKTWDKQTGARCLPSTVLVFSVHFIDWWVATTLQVRKPKSVVWPLSKGKSSKNSRMFAVTLEHVCLFWFPGFCSELVGNHSPNQQVSLVFILPTWPGSHAMWS